MMLLREWKIIFWAQERGIHFHKRLIILIKSPIQASIFVISSFFRFFTSYFPITIYGTFSVPSYSTGIELISGHIRTDHLWCTHHHLSFSKLLPRPLILQHRTSSKIRWPRGTNWLVRTVGTSFRREHFFSFLSFRLRTFFKLISLDAFSNISVVITDHFVEESFSLSGTGNCQSKQG